MTALAARMRAAADTLEEASALYGYPHPEHVEWSPLSLRKESVHVEATEPHGLYDVNCAGSCGWDGDE